MRIVSVGCANDSHTVFPIMLKSIRFPVSARFMPATELPDVVVDQTSEPSKSLRTRFPSLLNCTDEFSFTGRYLLAVQTILGVAEALKAGSFGSPMDIKKTAKRKTLQGAVQMKPQPKDGPNPAGFCLTRMTLIVEPSS